MIVQNLSSQKPFTTKDGSRIRGILDRTNAPVRNQSLAEAFLPAGGTTQLHCHKITEEFYFVLSGSGIMKLEDEQRDVGPGDCVLIPPNTWHEISAREDLTFLCCCAPPYSHDDTYFE
jgi:mannose-6-phosphate isomerase-like protein (cupin superfamily)